MIGSVAELLPRLWKAQQAREDLRHIGRILQETGERPDGTSSEAASDGCVRASKCHSVRCSRKRAG